MHSDIISVQILDETQSMTIDIGGNDQHIHSITWGESDVNITQTMNRHNPLKV